MSLVKTAEDMAIEVFRREYEEIRRQLTQEQLPIVENAIKQLTHLAQLRLADPANAERYDRDAMHLIGTIQSQAALAQIRVANAVIDSVARVTATAIDIFLGVAKRAAGIPA